MTLSERPELGDAATKPAGGETVSCVSPGTSGFTWNCADVVSALSRGFLTIAAIAGLELATGTENESSAARKTMPSV